MNIFSTDVSQLILKEHIINDHIATSKFLADGNLYQHVWKSVNIPQLQVRDVLTSLLCQLFTSNSKIITNNFPILVYNYREHTRYILFLDFKTFTQEISKMSKFKYKKCLQILNTRLFIRKNMAVAKNAIVALNLIFQIFCIKW